MEKIMPATLILPPGWLTTALSHSSVPCLLTEPASAVNALGLGLEPEAAWQRLRDLEQGEIPRIVTDRSEYRVVDVERTDGFVLYYTRQMGNGGETGRWELFFQDTPEDPDIFQVTRRQIWESLLQVYTDANLYVLPDEITYSRPDLKGSRLREDGATVHDVSLQNNHTFSVAYGPGYARPSINGFIKFLGHVPLSALTQIDEIRMVPEEKPAGGSTFREGRRLVNVYYPLLSGGDVGQDERAVEFYKFLYAVHHETYGHGLMYRNRFLRREMIKIVASGEKPPTQYAQTSIEEWFPEGIAERGVMTVLNDPKLDDWDRRYPYLSGLIRHVLGVMEDAVEPANENIGLWRDTLRPVRLNG
jgi:hypothetical protein